MNLENLDWDKSNGLIPAVIQDAITQQVLTLGFMNPESLQKTISTGLVTFYSRTKQRLWMKGETSNNVLHVVEIKPDCDQDTLLITVNLEGPCCHLNQRSCFSSTTNNAHVLNQLEQVIQSRYELRPEKRYTTELFSKGVQRIAQKVGEEGVEVALAAMSDSKEELINEAGDLLYHLLVLLTAKQIALQEVMDVLQERSAA